MKETVEFRILERHAKQYLPNELGVLLGDSVRRIRISTSDPLFEKVGLLDRKLRESANIFFTSWQIYHHYSHRELEEASLFYFWPKRTFEPEGEAGGTAYDESLACPQVLEPSKPRETSGDDIMIPESTCGAGARQVTPLFLKARSIPRKVDIARTIADEIVVSANAVAIFREKGLTGAKFEPIRFSNKPGRISEDHFQLTVAEPFVDVDPKTRFGDDPFDQESYGRCPFGHILGLNLLSEVTVTRANLTSADVMATKHLVGVRRGVLRPRPLLLMSPRAWRAIQAAKLKGFGFEVAYIAP